MSFVQFSDVMGVDAPYDSPDPAVLPLIALYATGSLGVAATAAQIRHYRDAGVGVALIDQTPGLNAWAAGWADIADVEWQAGLAATAISGALSRQAHGWQSTIYVSASNHPALAAQMQAAGVDMSLVLWGIANWSLSLEEAEQSLGGNTVFCQWASPSSNPATILPGTTLTLKEANADLDVALSSWADQFIPAKISAGQQGTASGH
jgi:hypothetical protein